MRLKRGIFRAFFTTLKLFFDFNSAVFPFNGLKYALMVYIYFFSKLGSYAIAGGDEETFAVSDDGSAAIVQQVTTLRVRQPLGAKPEERN